MANSLTIRTSAPGAKQAATEIGLLKSNVQGLATGMGGPAAALTGLGLSAAGAGLAISGIMDAAKNVGMALGGTIKAASDLNETVTKTEGVFGDSAGTMLDWAEDADHAFGQSKQSALDAATTFGGLFKTVGQSAVEAGNHARTMTELGSDLASFFNTDVSSALESLRSGLAGEAEPMRKFNVFLSEAEVNSTLLAMGQKKVNGAWTESQKIMGRFEIIMRQTTDAQGDFARTQDGLANTLRESQAVLDNMSAEIGSKLEPSMAKLARTTTDDVLPAIEDLIDIINGEADFTNSWIMKFSGIVKTAPGLIGEWAKAMETQGRIDEMGGNIINRLIAATEAKAQGEQKRLAQIGSFMASEIADRYQTVGEKEIGDGTDTIVRELVDNLVDGVRSNKDNVTSVMEDLTFAIMHPLRGAKELARIEGALTSRKMAEGLKSTNPFVRHAAEEARDDLIALWEGMAGRAYTGGVKIGNQAVRGVMAGWGGGPNLGVGVQLKNPKNNNNGGNKNQNNVRVNVKLTNREVHSKQKHYKNVQGNREFV